jgi:hypothetical protein
VELGRGEDERESTLQLLLWYRDYDAKSPPNPNPIPNLHCPLPPDSAFKQNLFAMYKFTRPHTIRGTILASFAGTTRALLDSPGVTLHWSRLLPKAFVGMLALLLGNAFIVGINQIYDKDIDTINKPFLPVASGEMTTR